MAGSAPAARAARAVWLAKADPAEARTLGEQALADALRTGDLSTACVAERALGLATQDTDDIAASAAHLRRAVRYGQRAGAAPLAAEARMSLAGTLMIQGKVRGALREMDRAAPDLRGVERARLEAQRATVMLEQGRVESALEGYERALPGLRRADDRLWLARLFINRGLLHCHRGALAAAESDLRAAERLSIELGQHRLVAKSRENLGLLASFRGDLPGALAWFDLVEDYFRDQDVSDASYLDPRCLALLDARLVCEARSVAETAVKALARGGRSLHLAKANLRLAEAALLDGDFPAAVTAADKARRAFASQHRLAWAAQAQNLRLRAAWRGGDRSPALLRDAQRTAGALAAAGLVVRALDADLLTAELALALGRPGAARTALLRARNSRSSGPVQVRSRAWHAEALLRAAEGNRRGAEAALRAGMRVMERYRAALGATELRAGASGHVTELAGLGIRLALEDGHPRRLLAWAERSRAGTIRLRPARPPDDARLADDLARLRAVVAELDAAALDGRPTGHLRARQAALEEAVRSRARHATGVLAASMAPSPSLGTIIDALEGRALLEVIEQGGELHAVVACAGRTWLRHLASAADVARELRGLRFALGLIARRTTSPASRAAARQAAEFGAGRLDDLLLAPVRAEIGDRPLVVVPTTVLHALPWSVLPSCRGRQVIVAPAAAVWHSATVAGRAPAEGAVVFIAGPRLVHAAREVASLARRYPGSRRLTGLRATCQAACSALDGARLAHVASHGRFRADNPLFSCLELSDGPLTVYDLERLERAPRTLVLASCESGVSEVRPGDELMGLAAAVLATGSTSLVASVFSVPDEATQPLMLAFHAELRTGASPAGALAAAQVRLSGGSDEEMAAAAGFVCFGGG